MQGSWLSLRRSTGHAAVPQGTGQGARLSPGSAGRRRRARTVPAAAPHRFRPAGSIAIAGLLSSQPSGAFLGCRDVSVVRDE